MDLFKVIKIITLFFIMAAFLSAVGVSAGEHATGDGKSFAEEYAKLSELLGKVKNQESAVMYKSHIAMELDRLKSVQLNGGDAFDALSDEEQQAFIEKYQNNHFHCGAVTQVMEERRRILLDPALSEILSSLIKGIP